MRHRDAGLHDRAARVTLLELTDERLVDLHLVDRQLVEAAERRVAGAEVVDGQPGAECAQLAQRLDRVGPVLHEQRLGDLEDQAVRVDQRAVQLAGDRRPDARLAHQPATHVDRHRQAGRLLALVPRAQLRARFANDPERERDDHPGLLGDGDEARRRDHAASGVMPAHQRFDGGDRAAAHVDDGLVDQREVLARDRMVHVALEREPFDHLGLHRVVVERDAVRALRLARVHR